jgi:Zinc finger, C3HC4 type (RING finger)
VLGVNELRAVCYAAGPWLSRTPGPHLLPDHTGALRPTTHLLVDDVVGVVQTARLGDGVFFVHPWVDRSVALTMRARPLSTLLRTDCIVSSAEQRAVPLDSDALRHDILRIFFAASSSSSSNSSPTTPTSVQSSSSASSASSGSSASSARLGMDVRGVDVALREALRRVEVRAVPRMTLRYALPSSGAAAVEVLGERADAPVFVRAQAGGGRVDVTWRQRTGRAGRAEMDTTALLALAVLRDALPVLSPPAPAPLLALAQTAVHAALPALGATFAAHLARLRLDFGDDGGARGEGGGSAGEGGGDAQDGVAEALRALQLREDDEVQQYLARFGGESGAGGGGGDGGVGGGGGSRETTDLWRAVERERRRGVPGTEVVQRDAELCRELQGGSSVRVGECVALAIADGALSTADAEEGAARRRMVYGVVSMVRAADADGGDDRREGAGDGEEEGGGVEVCLVDVGSERVARALEAPVHNATSVLMPVPRLRAFGLVGEEDEGAAGGFGSGGGGGGRVLATTTAAVPAVPRAQAPPAAPTAAGRRVEDAGAPSEAAWSAAAAAGTGAASRVDGGNVAALRRKARSAEAQRQEAETQRKRLEETLEGVRAHFCCGICMENTVDRVLVPSGQLICAECLGRLRTQQCPFTRMPITSVVEFRAPSLE